MDRQTNRQTDDDNKALVPYYDASHAQSL